MKKPNLPVDEHTRLETLQLLNILDTQPEERFDRLTRVAKRMFDVPIALVSLVDGNRQWFKSCIGLPVRETPRDISFCGHAILESKIFIIPDTLEDQRFADNPLVTEPPNIRFYAGCPLEAPNGSKLGTLCIIDTKPRQFDDNDMLDLADIAATVEKELSTLQMATMDELTNISNRRGFRMLAERSIKVATRHELPVTLIFFDLDKFKEINDHFGHAEGDKALVTFAGLMKKACRESDAFARLGGDEFAVLLSNTTIKYAQDFITRFKKSLDKINSASEHAYDITFSHGIVLFDAEKHVSIEQLLAEGDALMFEHKNS
jgi:diguanylate cyclase (GGDEF)-like protein